MKKISHVLAIALLVTSPYALASSDLQATIDAPNSTAPLYIQNIVTSGLNVVNQVCNDITCTFKLTGATFWHWKGSPDSATVTIGNSKTRNCAFTFDDNGTILHYSIRLANATCTGGFTSGGLQGDHITIYGQ